MTPTATRTPGFRVRDRRQQVADVLVAALALVTLLCAALLDRPPSFVARLDVVNPTQYHVVVDVRGAAGQPSWLALGTVPRESSRSVEQVLDQGERWIVRFSYGGFVGGEVTLSRTEARRITVPPEVGARLAEAGFTPSAF